MTLAAYSPPATPRAWIELLPNAVELAKAVANTDFVPSGLRGNPAAITACILYGDEVGLAPMAALAHISVIDGRPSMSSEAMRGLIFAAGHEIRVEQATNTRASVIGRRRDSDQWSEPFTWTLDDAKRANLQGKMNWRKYPRQMLVARATAELARALFPDAIGGLVATEELEDETDEPPGDSPGGGASPRRRRRATLAPVSAPAEPEPEPATAVPPLPGEDPSAPEPATTSAAGGPAEAESGPTQQSAPLGLSEDAPNGSASDAEGMSEAQRGKMMALFRECGFDTTEAGRPSRLAFTRFVIGRAIDSSAELTLEEASTVIDALQHHADALGFTSGD